MAYPTQTPFHLQPMGAGFSQTWEWSTEISRSDNNTETRTQNAIETVPVRSTVIPVSPHVLEDANSVVHLLVYAGGMQSSAGFVVPLWWSASTLTGSASGTNVPASTEDREFDSVEIVMLMKADWSDWELGTVSSQTDSAITLADSVVGSYVEGDIVVPMIIATPTNAVGLLSGALDWEMEGGLEFYEIEELNRSPATIPALSGFNTYLTYPIYRPTLYNQRNLTIYSSHMLHGMKNLLQSKDRAGLTDVGFAFEVIQESQAERMALVNFFNNRQGRTSPLWFPSQRDDFVLAQAASSSATQLVLTGNSVSEALFAVNRHIYVAASDQYVKMTNATVVGNGIRVDISAALTADLPSGYGLEMVIFGRFASDALTIESIPGEIGNSTATLRVIELQRETA